MFLPNNERRDFLSRSELRWLAFTVITASVVKAGEKIAEKLIDRYWPEKAEEEKP